MPAYLLRYADTKLLAGFYAADSLRHLFYLIDQDRDAGDYECAVIKSGFGIEFRIGYGTVEVAVDDPELSATLATAEWIFMTDELRWDIEEPGKLRWRQIDWPVPRGL
jgi:hypothetical protein